MRPAAQGWTQSLWQGSQCACALVCVRTSEKEEAAGPTVGPGLVDGGLLPELLGQVVEPLQPADLVQQPLLVALLRLLQVLPAIVDVLWGQERAGPSQEAAEGQWQGPGSCLALPCRVGCREPSTLGPRLLCIMHETVNW